MSSRAFTKMKISIVLILLQTTEAFHLLPKPLSIQIHPRSLSTAANQHNCLIRQNTLLESSTNYYEFPKRRKTSLKVSHVSFPFIKTTDSWGNIASICSIASLSHRIGQTTSIGRLLGPPVTAMAIAFTLGSIGFLPSGM